MPEPLSNFSSLIQLFFLPGTSNFFHHLPLYTIYPSLSNKDSRLNLKIDSTKRVSATSPRKLQLQPPNHLTSPHVTSPHSHPHHPQNQNGRPSLPNPPRLVRPRNPPPTKHTTRPPRRARPNTTNPSSAQSEQPRRGQENNQRPNEPMVATWLRRRTQGRRG